ncbi:transposase [Anaerobacillus sp. MEB173]|uniref:transposase n=1 Tax=Anaerobacillus sp. MEB173 TaxID=3383345 RepID=UPI003F93C661
MKPLLIVGSIIFPMIMVLCARKWRRIPVVFNVGAMVAALIFGNIASIAIYNIIIDNTVFMTNIHGIFLNPVFLVTGAYLGLYLFYLLAIYTLHSVKG